MKLTCVTVQQLRSSSQEALPLSRLRTLFLFGTALALAAVLAACGGSGGGSSENPQKVVDDATLQGIQSGNVDLSLGVDVEGDKGGNVDVSLSGPFQSQGSNQFPQLDMTAKASGSINGKDVNFDGGLTLLSDRAFVNYKGTEYEIDPTTFSFVKSLIKQAQQKGQGGQGQGGVSQSCQNAISDLKVNDFVNNLSNDGSSDVGGTSTTHVSGDLNVSGAMDALIGIAENPACSSQLGSAGQIPPASQLDQAKALLSSALKTAHVDLYVGDDDIVRRISAQLTIEPPAGSGSGPKKVDVSLDLTLTDVNQPQTISAPSGAKPINELFQQLGINPLSLVGPGGLGGLSGGAGGLGGLLNGIGAGSAGGSSGSGGSNPQQAYLQCLQRATTPADLQKCASLQ
jgi:hypothetical protein